jgi:hypothetical protein
MEENQPVNSQTSSQEDTNYSPGKQLMVGVSVTLFIFVAGFFGYIYFQGHFTNQSNANKPVLSASTNQITPIATPNPNPQGTTAIANTTPASSNQTAPAQTTKACLKNGPAQKWEYLVPYVVKDGDTLQSIATTQLNDANRVNEIIQLNGQGPYVVGSTLYLPPSSITKSSGNIKEIYGMLISKDSSYWHISYSSDPKGLGVVIPSFWFDGLANESSFNTGDCITVLFDDGNKVFSVALQ